MTFKQKGFPMHSTKSALKQYEKEIKETSKAFTAGKTAASQIPVVTDKPVVTEEETVPTPPKNPKFKTETDPITGKTHKTMLTWGWEIDPITGKRTKVPRYQRQ